MWERKTNILKGVYKSDKAIVNCVQPHPTLPLIATSGIDHEISLWSPRPINVSPLDFYINWQTINNNPFQNEYEKCKIEPNLVDNLVAENQSHMQNDSYEFGIGPDSICRAS